MRSAIIECTTDPGFLLKIRGKYLFEPMVLHADLNISVFTDPVMNEKRRYTAQQNCSHLDESPCFTYEQTDSRPNIPKSVVSLTLTGLYG